MNIFGSWWKILLFLAIAQVLVILSSLIVHTTAWRVRHNRAASLVLGTPGLLFVGLCCYVFSYLSIHGLFQEHPDPPDFVDLTWPYTIASGLMIFVTSVGVAFIHRKQFGLSLQNGFFGFYFDVGWNLVAFVSLFFCIVGLSDNFLSDMNSLISECLINYYILFYGACWLLLTFFRPALLRLEQRVRCRNWRGLD